MNMYLTRLQTFLTLVLIFFIASAQASPHHKRIFQPRKRCCCPLDAVTQRAMKEDFIPLRYIAIAFHKPNYVLPFYYTGSPYNNVYLGQTPNNESIKKTEVNYQVSLKVPLWKDIYDYPTSLYFGYTLLSYWQAYSRKPFVRENDYEPEFFVSSRYNRCLYRDWRLNFLNYGYTHQSNGFGDNLERSWDRVYVEAVTSVNNLMISLKPWYIVHRNPKNSNIGSYLGYGRLLLAYNFCDNVLAFEITNLIVPARRTTGKLTLSVPLTSYVKVYAEGFSGYGQSLIEYNHRTNSFGLGFAVSDWL